MNGIYLLKRQKTLTLLVDPDPDILDLFVMTGGSLLPGLESYSKTSLIERLKSRHQGFEEGLRFENFDIVDNPP